MAIYLFDNSIEKLYSYYPICVTGKSKTVGLLEDEIKNESKYLGFNKTERV